MFEVFKNSSGKISLLIPVVLILLFLSATVFGLLENYIPVQMRVTGPGGNQNADLNVTLVLFNASSGGTQLGYSQRNLAAKDGLVSGLFGPYDYNSDTNVWARIDINGETMNNRIQLGSAPAALTATKANIKDKNGLTLGDDQDVNLTFDGVDLNLYTRTDDRAFRIGNGGTSFDINWYANAVGNYVQFDASENKVQFTDVNLYLTGTRPALVFGDSADYNFVVDRSSPDLNIRVRINNSRFNIGQPDSNLDVMIYGDLNVLSGSKLYVSGDLNVDGNFFVKLPTIGTNFAVCHTGDQNNPVRVLLTDCDSNNVSDYAEQYPIKKGVSFGDVVVTGSEFIRTKDGERLVQLVKSSKPYQSNVLGVASNNYGDFSSVGYNIEDKDNPLPVALSGRVLTKVSKENGAIQPGDLLTTSSLPGVAMKWSLLDVSNAKNFEELKQMIAENDKRRQAVLGKALNSFNGSGVGEILVFLE